MVDSLQTLSNIKEDIKNSIINKGGIIKGGLSTYAKSIRDITSDTYDIEYIRFRGSTIKTFNTPFNTSKMTNMKCMFQDCYNLESINLSGWDTSNVINMTFMFGNCHSLTSLDLSHFNTSKVTDMSYMFYFCQSLTSLDLSHFNTSKVTDMSYMFNSCSSLTSIDIRNFDFTNVSDMTYFFSNGGNNGKLTDVKFGKNLKVGWTGNGSPYRNPNLSKESLLSIIDGLYDFVKNGQSTTRTCQFGSTNLSKLTSNEIAKATAKGWTLSS